MPLESLHDGSLGLSNVLHATCFTANAIHQVGALTGNMLFAVKSFLSNMACYFACCVQKGTISTVFPGNTSVFAHVCCGNGGKGVACPQCIVSLGAGGGVHVPT